MSHKKKSECVPDSMKSLLESLIDDEISIILGSGEKECVEVEAVRGDILYARVDDKIKVINIDCICCVIVECDDLLDDLLCHKKCEEC